MLKFNFENKSEIIFGCNDELVLAKTLKRFGASKVLICYGGGGGHYLNSILERVKAVLTSESLQFSEFGGIIANPLRGHALKGVEAARESKADFILAIGGGSVIDTAKFIAAGVMNANVWSLFQSGDAAGLETALPLGAVLTIPAAGSEGSSGTVIRDELTGKKYAIMAECLRPKFAFINPAYCTTLPSQQIANGASDILAHLMERYFSPQKNIRVTDKLLAAAMQSVLEIAPTLYKDSKNYDLWSEFCLLGLIAHNGMLDMGRGIQDWACHVIENNFLSGTHNIAHGAGLAIMFPAWLKHVGKMRPAKVLQFAKEVMQASGKTEGAIISDGIARLESFYKTLKLPTTLSEVGIDADDVKKLAADTFPVDITLGGYGQLSFNDIERIITLAK
ncbi:MAG: iron-containing alcohol dehydrogenase [Firmicutes bacterium]|nr:iron-containing alcohol dehydrogenase [Bacillota bacterium]